MQDVQKIGEAFREFCAENGWASGMREVYPNVETKAVKSTRQNNMNDSSIYLL